MGGQERRGIVVDDALRAVEERLDRVDEVLLGVQQVIAKVEIGQVPVVRLADGLVEQVEGGGELGYEGVLGARGGLRLKLVALPLKLVRAVPGEFQRVLGRAGLIEELGAECAERGDLGVVEGLLPGDHGVLLLLRVAERGGDFGALEDVAIDGERDLRGADQEGDHDLDRGEVPAVGLGLEASTMVLTVTCSPRFSLRIT